MEPCTLVTFKHNTLIDGSSPLNHFINIKPYATEKKAHDALLKKLTQAIVDHWNELLNYENYSDEPEDTSESSAGMSDYENKYIDTLGKIKDSDKLINEIYTRILNDGNIGFMIYLTGTGKKSIDCFNKYLYVWLLKSGDEIKGDIQCFEQPNRHSMKYPEVLNLNDVFKEYMVSNE